MNFKKNQRRIPMNFKKIIPLSFAALSVAGVLSACSDSAVVGADVQGNSVAETTTVVEPVLGPDVQRVLVARLKEVAKPNAPTSAILAHDSTLQLTVVKTFDGDSIYNNEKNRILSMNYLDTTITENKGWTYYSMQDENGVLHGPIAMAQTVLGFPNSEVIGYVNNVACLNENKWIKVGDDVYKYSDYYEFSSGFGSVGMRLQTRDSLMRAQFIEDCNAEDGTIREHENSYSFSGLIYKELLLDCNLTRNDLHDSYWEKYASFIVNDCRSDVVSNALIPVEQCPEDKCTGSGVESDTMAEESSSPVEAALRSVSKGTAVTYSHIAGNTVYQTDTVTAHETFDRVVQSILDFDPTVRYSEEGFSGPRDSYSTFVVMKDEEGLVHGEIMLDGSEYGVEREISVSCGIEYAISNDGNVVQILTPSERLAYNGSFMNTYQVFFNSKSHPYHVPNTAVKYMRSMDSTIREEFRKDCALENGTIDNGEGDDPQIVCLVNSEEVNGVETYRDPNWKKYAKFIIDGCVTTKKFDELFEQ